MPPKSNTWRKCTRCVAAPPTDPRTVRRVPHLCAYCAQRWDSTPQKSWDSFSDNPIVRVPHPSAQFALGWDSSTAKVLGFFPRQSNHAGAPSIAHFAKGGIPPPRKSWDFFRDNPILRVPHPSRTLRRVGFHHRESLGILSGTIQSCGCPILRALCEGWDSTTAKILGLFQERFKRAELLSISAQSHWQRWYSQPHQAGSGWRVASPAPARSPRC